MKREQRRERADHPQKLVRKTARTFTDLLTEVGDLLSTLVTVLSETQNLNGSEHEPVRLGRLEGMTDDLCSKVTRLLRRSMEERMSSKLIQDNGQLIKNAQEVYHLVGVAPAFGLELAVPRGLGL